MMAKALGIDIGVNQEAVARAAATLEEAFRQLTETLGNVTAGTDLKLYVQKKLS